MSGWTPDGEPRPRSFAEMMGFREPSPAEVAEQEGRLAADLAKGKENWATLPFFRLFRRCPKCRCWRFKVVFHPAAADPDRPLSYCRGNPTSCIPHAGPFEHFFRACQRCGHFWWERPRAQRP